MTHPGWVHRTHLNSLWTVINHGFLHIDSINQRNGNKKRTIILLSTGSDGKPQNDIPCEKYICMCLSVNTTQMLWCYDYATVPSWNPSPRRGDSINHTKQTENNQSSESVLWWFPTTFPPYMHPQPHMMSSDTLQPTPAIMINTHSSELTLKLGVLLNSFLHFRWRCTACLSSLSIVVFFYYAQYTYIYNGMVVSRHFHHVHTLLVDSPERALRKVQDLTLRCSSCLNM